MADQAAMIGDLPGRSVQPTLPSAAAPSGPDAGTAQSPAPAASTGVDAGHDRTAAEVVGSDRYARIAHGDRPAPASYRLRLPNPDGADDPISRPRLTPATRLRVYLELGKARLNGLVLVTTAVGFAVAADGGLLNTTFALLLVGTALTAGGSAAFNQIIETARDRLMVRTEGRPLPAGVLSRTEAVVLATLATVAGLATLALATNLLTAGIAATVWVVYVVIYTPAKARTTWCTLIGAVCGALPPMMGVSAATGTLTPTAWWLGALLFAWQLPHFYALSWFSREDYQRADLRMLACVDPDGTRTSGAALRWALALVAVTVASAALGIASAWFAVIAGVLGSALIALALAFRTAPTKRRAKRLFLASVIYLPVLLGALVVDNALHPVAGAAAENADASVQPE